MLYKESSLPEKEAQKRSRHSEPYNAPTHAGGLFAIRRDWFKQLGWYDPGIYLFSKIVQFLDSLILYSVVKIV